MITGQVQIAGVVADLASFTVEPGMIIVLRIPARTEREMYDLVADASKYFAPAKVVVLASDIELAVWRVVDTEG